MNVEYVHTCAKFVEITDIWLQMKYIFSYTYHPFLSLLQFSSVQSLSHVRLFATPWIAACQASLTITNSQSSPKPMSIKSVMPSSHLFFSEFICFAKFSADLLMSLSFSFLYKISLYRKDISLVRHMHCGICIYFEIWSLMYLNIHSFAWWDLCYSSYTTLS